MNTYPITYWYGIRENFLCKERFNEAKEAGFNLVECSYSTENNKKALAICEELGLMANIADPRMQEVIKGEDGWEAILDEIISDYKDYPAFNRFFVKDEPTNDWFPTLERIVTHLHKRGCGEYINLFPNLHLGSNENYIKHVNEYLDTVHPELLSYDHYSFMKEEVTERTGRPLARMSDDCIKRNGWQGKIFEAYDRAGYFDNLEIIRSIAAERDMPWMNIILLVEHWNYRWLTEAELRWEVFSTIAYGADGLSYFTYWTPGVNHTEPWSYHNAIINSDGSRSEFYEIVKGINAEIRAITSALPKNKNGLASTAVFHIGKEQDEKVRYFEGYGDVRSIDAYALVAGFFENGMIVLSNKDHDSKQTVTIHTDKEISIFDKITEEWKPLPDKTLILSEGDGELISLQ